MKQKRGPGRPLEFDAKKLLEERQAVIRGIRDCKEMWQIAQELGYATRQSLARHKGVRREALSKIKI